MPNLDLGSRPFRGTEGGRMSAGHRDVEASLGGRAGDGRTPAQRERDRLARDLAEIERATAALRKGVPDLESWSGEAPAVELRKPRPLWLMIGLLWLSTVLVTAGAVAAIARLVG